MRIVTRMHNDNDDDPPPDPAYVLLLPGISTNHWTGMYRPSGQDARGQLLV